MPWYSGLSSASTASLVPVIASGTMLETSCAINPSTKVLVSSAIKLNRAGFSCLSLVVASQV